MRKLSRFLNWLNGTKERPRTWGRQPILPLPEGDKPLTMYEIARTRPLSEKLKVEYRRGRDTIIGGFKDGE